jgi:hypothetical protein
MTSGISASTAIIAHDLADGSARRCRVRGATFFCGADYAQYHGWLAEAVERHGCRIHADVLKTSLSTQTAPD